MPNGEGVHSEEIKGQSPGLSLGPLFGCQQEEPVSYSSILILFLCLRGKREESKRGEIYLPERLRAETVKPFCGLILMGHIY